MYVVGKTSAKELWVASVERPFVLDEYLIIEDEQNESPVGEVVETFSYPMIEKDLFPLDSGIYQSLEKLKIQSGEKPIFLARLKLIKELQTPILPFSKVRTPSFSEVKALFYPLPPDEGLVLGVVRGTENMQQLLPKELQSLSPLLDSQQKMTKQNGIPFIFPHYALREYPHIGLFGGSGSGKTFGIRVFCEEIMKKGIPGVVFDPHYELSFQHRREDDFKREPVSFENKYELFQIGKNAGIYFPDLTTEDLIMLLEFKGEMSPPMRGALEELHHWNDSYVTLSSRIQKLKEAMEFYEQPERMRKGKALSEECISLYEKYKHKVAGIPTLQAISWRLEQLNKTGIFSYDISSIENCLLNRKLAVIRGDLDHLKMFAAYLIKKLYWKRRRYKDWQQLSVELQRKQELPSKFPPFFIIMDEAHIFAPNGNIQNPTKRILREISQEARKYGVFEILGTQRPSLLDTTISSQLTTKFIFRTRQDSDLKAIQAEANLTEEQMKRIPDLTSGNAFVSSAILRKPFYIRFRATETLPSYSSHPFDELENYGIDSSLKEALLQLLPLEKKDLPKKQQEVSKILRRYVSLEEMTNALEMMAEQKEILKEDVFLGVKYYLLEQ